MHRELLYKDLSYRLVGLAYEIDNKIGYGHREKIYADAFEELLKRETNLFKREVYYPIKNEGKTLAKRFFDFLVDDKIVIEVKVGDREYKNSCYQLFEYLKTSQLKLGLIVRFTRDGVKIKRIPNYY
ncbi:MAG: GxxExxY protein [Candidatus Berkelbacteria bacterium]|nr:GxxExxY protein [Candidatus Berkelbacteria bacterium]